MPELSFEPTRAAGLAKLDSFVATAGKAYAAHRNEDPDPDCRQHVSMLSPWLHAGLIGEREVLSRVLDTHSASAADKFISEVFWRVYFKGYLEQRPTVWSAYLEERDAALARLDENSGLRRAYDEAVSGKTGIAAFDLWARELVRDGYLHNHARMWFASIWIFTLKLDWTLGADFFLRHLMDGDAASNTLSWRWVGGLHTKGKTYLARASNIARYTQGRSAGPLLAEGLAKEAPPLEDTQEHARQLPDLPGALVPDAPFALLLHDEAASHEPLALERPPSLIIGAARPGARSPEPVGDHARDFAERAVANGVAAAADHFGCPGIVWKADEAMPGLPDGVSTVLVPWLPIGWTRDALFAPLMQSNATVEWYLDPLSAETWPHAKAGFFGVKKKMADAMRAVGLPA
ncbi:FAD-binding domain-containing protein [Sphingomicrobium sediminis]|uniref:DNA photolyase n=1 Tax=Sphingomicrobium sediminis TaxID=2950949 RepID=A0A9X2EMA2_9SPHN|nr:FAD-binding domain-containing protein [Sphingomicrobium sediminis]MCM8557999.1 DNA photolyase [Sphingomicrobium sediminis]